MSSYFSEKKCIHIQLDKIVHTSLRAKLFNKGVSMQELFNEFARMLANDHKSACVILDKTIANKLLRALESTQPVQRGRNESFGELETDALYNLINSGGLKKKNDPNPRDDDEIP